MIDIQTHLPKFVRNGKRLLAGVLQIATLLFFIAGWATMVAVLEAYMKQGNGIMAIMQAIAMIAYMVATMKLLSLYTDVYFMRMANEKTTREIQSMIKILEEMRLSRSDKDKDK